MKKGVEATQSIKKPSPSSARVKIMATKQQAVVEPTHFPEERFKQAFDDLLEGCMIIGFDWTYLYVNDVAAVSAQNKPKNLIGHTMLEMYPGVEKSQVFAHYKECMEKRTPQRFEESFTFADGATHWYTFSAEPVPEGIFVLSIDISEQKKAEETARLGQEEFEQFFQNAPLYCYMVSSQGVIERMNAAALTALEYSQKEIVGKPFTTIYAPEALSKMQKFFEQWKKEGVLRDVESIIQTKSGKKLDILLNVGAIRGPAGEILHSISIQQDVTQKKAGLAKLATYPALNPSPVVEVDNSGKIEYINPAAERLFPDLGSRGFGHPFLVGIEQYLNKKQATVTREVLVNGRSFQQNITKVPESTVYRIYCADITERKLAEEKFEQLAAIVQSSEDAIIGKTLDGIITSWNKGAEKVYGYTEEEAVGKPISLLIPPGREDELPRILKTIKAGNHVDRCETVRRKKDGTDIQVSLMISPVQDIDGKVVGASTIARDITERKKAEEIVFSTSQYTRSLIEASLDPLVTISANGKITDVNKATETVTGYSRDKLIQTDFSDYFVDPEKARAGYQRVFREGFVRDYPLEIRHKSGRVTAVLYNASVYKDKLGNVVGVFAAARDITERKQAELEREQYFKFFNLSTDIMVIADPNGAFKKVNPTCLKVLGYSEAELLSKPFADFVHPDDKQSTLDEMARQIKIGFSLNFENRYLCRDGRVLWLSWKANYDKNDGITYATARDITERKQAELEVSRANRALRVVSGINQALIHVTDEAALLNEACRIAVEVGKHRMAWIGFAENDEAKSVRPTAKAGFDSGYVDSVNVTWSDTERGHGPTGSAVRLKKIMVVREIATDPIMAPWRKAALEHGYLSSIALPLLNEDGSCLGVLTIYSGEPNAFGEKEMSILQELTDDLTFGITTLRLRKKIEERTKEVDQLKNKFIQIVSHQLRTPLSVIRWDLESILDRERGEVAPAQVETLRGAYAANIEIISRLDDLLVAMDIEEGRVRLEIDTMGIGELLQSVCEEKLQPCQLKKIMYEIVPPATPLPTIRGDAVKIRDVVARLIDNAITYSNDGGRIGVKFFVADKKIRFEITDTGVGIPVSEQPHIFERFHRGWNAALMKPDASGLSLFISKNYINAHHGTIGFSSTEKKGSTFWFELPIA